jgi:hypothetical protein
MKLEKNGRSTSKERLDPEFLHKLRFTTYTAKEIWGREREREKVINAAGTGHGLIRAGNKKNKAKKKQMKL